jgi:threonine dehydrogenase-like Zn-dependent dehydrogenase
MKAVVVERLAHRFAAARVASLATGSGGGIGIGPVRLMDLDPLGLPGPDWVRIRPRLAGICGSDLSTVDGASSRYFEDIVSFPFVLGLEIVADVVSDGQTRRVVVEPVLGCLARGITPPCPACAKGKKGSCERLAFGHIHPGLQTGFCRDTGGGWSEELVAHESQLHDVPESFSDEAAVMVEPAACATHAALGAHIQAGERVVVLGSGTLGLLTTAALRHFCDPATLIAVARHPIQRDLASSLGADQVVEEDELGRAARRLTGSLSLGKHPVARGHLTGGVDVVFDCVGTSRSIEEALSVTRPGGRIVLVGMPGSVKVDLAPLWHREITLVGAYAYGVETRGRRHVSTFDLAFELVESMNLARLVSAHYPLDRFEEAVKHAAAAGRRGSVKVVFDLRRSTRRDATAGAAALGSMTGTTPDDEVETL